MTEWQAQIDYNCAQSYNAYSCSFVYQGAGQDEVNDASSWIDAELAELCSDFSPGEDDFPPAVVAAAALINPEVELSPPSHQQSSDQHAQLYDSDFDPYRMVYFDESEGEGLMMPGQARENDGRRAGSESASDSEPQNSPDSWSSSSVGDSVLPQANPVLWALRSGLDSGAVSTSPDSTENLSIAQNHAQPYRIIGNEGVNNAVPPGEAAATAPRSLGIKGKVRSAFSEVQMNILTQRFNVQRYLTPAEMKNMAEYTGLTYKQVKTWFQNRRMKLRRHQKDNSWASERYSLNKDKTGPFPNLALQMQPFQGPARPALKDNVPPHMALYLAAAGFPSWPNSAGPSSLHPRPLIPGWPLPPDAAPYGYNARFSVQSLSGVPEGEPPIRGAPGSVFVQNASQ